METQERTKEVFDALKIKQREIESRINTYPKPEWVWNRADAYYFSSISIRRDGSIDDPPEKLDEIRDWMLGLAPQVPAGL